MKITIYTKPDCTICHQIMDELRECDDIELIEMDAESMPDSVREFVTVRQGGALPAVVVGDSGVIVPAKMVLTGGWRNKP